MADSTTVFAAKDESFSATVNRLQKSLGSFEGNLSTFNERAANMGKTFAGLAVKLAALGVAFLGVRGAVRSMGAAIELGGQLNDLSARTGETAGNLLILRRAFENAGAGAESVGITINRLQRNIVEGANGAKAQAEAFDKLGLSAAKLKEMTPTEQLQAVARALRDLENDSDRTNLAMLLLGRSGGELIPLFRAMDIELARANKQVGRAAELMNALNPDLDRISDNFKTIGDKSTDFALGLISSLVPALADVTERLSMIDAAAVGEKFSIYLKRTVDWAAASLGLASALQNVEVAVKAIAAGNFADGLNLMFLTARDTALNAINNIVAAAQAALTTVGEALKTLFNKNSVTFAYIRGSVMWLGAFISEQISGGLADSLEAFGRAIPEMMRPMADKMANSFLPGIRFMGKQLQGVINDLDASPISVSLRQAQDEAAKASADYFNLFYHEADNLKKEWADVGRAMPESFAKSYKANMENPLFEMKDRAAQTADQMERVAAATRAAAFDAEKFGQALRDAQVDRLAGIFEGGESEMAQNRDGKNFSWQGAGPSGSQGGGGAGGGEAPTRRTTSLPAPKPQSNLDLLRQQGQTDPRARAEMMRLQNESAATMNRANNLRDRGFFSSAANVEMRAERQAEQRAERFNARQLASDRFGGNNMGESFRAFKNMMVEQGVFSTVSQKDFEKWARDQVRSEKERERSDKASGAGGKEAAKGSDPMGGIVSQLDRIIKEITDRLPQHALT
jgi:hypothetical protein